MKAETKRVAYEMEVEHEKKTTRLQERKKQLQGEMSLGVVPRLELGQLEKQVEAHNFLLDRLQTENASKTVKLDETKSPRPTCKAFVPVVGATDVAAALKRAQAAEHRYRRTCEAGTRAGPLSSADVAVENNIEMQREKTEMEALKAEAQQFMECRHIVHPFLFCPT